MAEWRFDFLCFFLPEAGLLLDCRKDDVRVGMESEIGLGVFRGGVAFNAVGTSSSLENGSFKRSSGDSDFLDESSRGASSGSLFSMSGVRSVDCSEVNGIGVGDSGDSANG